MAFTCRAHGTEPHNHTTVALARRHHLDPTVGLCGWRFELRGRFGAEYNEDGEQIILECTGLLWETNRGWECEHGHEHVTAEVRDAEGWDYVADVGEALALANAGREPRDMQGRVWIA